MSNGKGKAEETKAETEEKEPTIEELLSELPIKDEHKALLGKLIGGVGATLGQINARIETLEKQPAPENPDIYEGLSAEQKYQVMIAKASAPAAAAQQGLIQSLLARSAGGSGSDIDQLVSSADKINSLRAIFSPEPSAVQTAMERAQVAQVIAQTRLMNKVAGKETDKYLDKLAAELGEGATGGEEG